MRPVLPLLVLTAIACDGRALAPADGKPPVVHKDASPTIDQSSEAFCASGPKVMIDGQLLPVSRVESGPIYMGCCDGWYARFVAHRPTGQEVRVTFSFKWVALSTPPPQHVDLSTDPDSFWVTCDPISVCGELHSFEAVFEGTLDATPTGAFPGYHIDLCLSATPKDTVKSQIRLSARQQLIVLTNPQCDWGKDQTCNHDSFVSSIKGKCNGDGTCTCHEDAKKIPITGKCQ